MRLLSKRRILVIDDQDAIHQDYRKIICPPKLQSVSLDAMEAEMFGNPVDEADEWDLYEIDSAYQGQDAVAMVEQSLQEGTPYAVAFVDIRMPPGWDGIRTVRRIWEIDPEVLVVLCSAYSDYSWQDIVRELGRTDRFLILKKPFDNVEVRQCAAALAERWVVARTDALTGILNRRAFEEHLRREWAFSLRHERPLACVMLDLDLFKVVNDVHGHQAGDKALQSVTHLLKQHAPGGSTLCRFGGEELCVLMPGSDEADAALWADNVRKRIANEWFDAGEQKIQLTVSGGVASLSAAAFRQEDLILQADAALRGAKQAGRNRIYQWSQLSEPEHHLERVHQYAAQFANLTAGDIMTRSVQTVQQDTIVGEAAMLFLNAGLCAAPVVDQSGELVGMLSEKDIIESLGVSEGWSNRVENIMTPRVIQYQPDTPADQIFRFLCRVHLRRVIITEQQRPVGVITCGSFLKWFCSLADERELACGTNS